MMGWLLVIVVSALVLGGKGSSSSSDLPKPPKPKPDEFDGTVFEEGPYTVVVYRGHDYGFSGWGFRVYWTYMFEKAGPDLDYPGQGLEYLDQRFGAKSEAAAVQAAKDWIADQVDGDAGPQPLTRRGLRLTGDCEQIQVVDLEAWISHAAERVRQNGAELEPGELMADAFLSVFPDRCANLGAPQIRDRTWAQVEASVAKVLEKFREGTFASVEPPEEAIAARLVGMSAPAREGEALLRPFGGGALEEGGVTYLIVIERHPNGSWWRALVWDNPWRDGMPVASWEKDTQAKAKKLAVDWTAAQQGA